MQRTVNYELCQYEGSDKTSYLVNYNSDMLKIDTAIKNAADAATAAQSKADTADGKADTNAGAISTLNTQINGESGLAVDVTTLQGAVNTITSLIGNGEPTTTDKTLIGAINEIQSKIVKIDNCYVTNEANTIFASVAFDSVKTRAEVLAELRSAFLTYLSNLPATKKVKISTIKCGAWVRPVFDTFYGRDTASSVQLEGSAFGFSPSGNNQVISMVIPSDSSNILFKVAELSAGGTAVTDKSSEVGTSGYATIEGVIYEQV